MHLALYFMADTLQKSFFPTLVENTKIAGNYMLLRYVWIGKGRVQSPKNFIHRFDQFEFSGICFQWSTAVPFFKIDRQRTKNYWTFWSLTVPLSVRWDFTPKTTGVGTNRLYLA